MSLHSKKEQIHTLREQGFVVVPGLVSAERCEQMKQIAQRQLEEAAAPIEFEADLQYPGAPSSKLAPGGHTVRRLLDAYGRDRSFAQWATAPEIRGWMELYFGEEPRLSRAHHNCMMTKHPAYGSLTGWHRDVRYWSFERDDLVSVWLALGDETVDNGALWLVPGSHSAPFTGDRFDDAKSQRAIHRRSFRRRQVLPLRSGGKPGVDSRGRFARTESRRRGVLPLQYAALGGQELERSGEVLARLHVSRREQCAVARNAVGREA